MGGHLVDSCRVRLSDEPVFFFLLFLPLENCSSFQWQRGLERTEHGKMVHPLCVCVRGSVYLGDSCWDTEFSTKLRL